MLATLAACLRPSRLAAASAAARGLASVPATLNYQQPVDGKRVGRYIGVPDAGELADEHVATRVTVGDARAAPRPFTIFEDGFELRAVDAPSEADLAAPPGAEGTVYNASVADAVRRATGCERVLVFDHTVRESGGARPLNALQAGATAGTVARVHADYTEASGRARAGAVLEAAGIDPAEGRRVALVNVWQPLAETPARASVLAMCAPRDVPAADRLVYEMQYGDRAGENTAVLPGGGHRWWYYPDMVRGEALVFCSYDSRGRAGGGLAHPAFHTAFEPPEGAGAPPRRSVEARAVAVWPAGSAARPPPRFFDMKHSNNAARVRLWLRLKRLGTEVDTTVVTYADLQSDDYAEVNPLRKVPAMVDAAGGPIFESNVILDYLEDKYGNGSGAADLTPPTAERRAAVRLLCRAHDLYVASPNCTQPNFSHTQGAMYLGPRESKFTPAARVMDRPTRAAKVAELFKQLTWLEARAAEAAAEGPYLAGGQMTHADLTWFPTAVFMEYMLPRVFGWHAVFRDGAHFPALAAWFQHLEREHPEFARTREEIWEHWVAMDEAGQFDDIRGEAEDASYKWKWP